MFPSIPLSPQAVAVKNEILSIPCTSEAFLDDLPDGLTPEEIETLHDLALNGAKSGEPVIRKYIARFPEYPTLLNYLRIIYQQNNRDRQADKVLKQLADEHPDYLFTRVGLAMKALDSKQTEKAAAALGPDLDIRKLYPERALFHVSEMRNYYLMVAIVHARRGDTDSAHGVKAALERIARDPQAEDLIMREIMMANLQRMKERTREDQKRRIEVRIPPLSKKVVTTASPSFQHEEIGDLYEYGMDLPVEIIREILALPRQTLVEDLARVLDDCADRAPNFMKGDVEESEDCAPFHALHLLAEVDGAEALESLLRFLSLHPDALDFWLGDVDYSPQIARIVAGDIPRCTAWLKSPAIAHRAKGRLMEAMEHLARTDPRRMEEVVASMEEVLAFLLESPRADNVLDTRFLSLLVAGAIELRARRLLPLIETAYRKNYVEEFMIGTLDSAITDISEPPRAIPETPSIAVQYRAYQNKNEGPPAAPAGFGAMEDSDPPQWLGGSEPAGGAPEAGRNDPCPCGSGRKYKKCCMN